MKGNTPPEEKALRRRVQRFLASDLYGRREVREFLQEVGELGDVAIFGGMLRDLALAGNKNFSSDIDLVIDTTDLGKLEKVLVAYKPARNKFGGYRLTLQRWTLDLWPLLQTWAFRSGHVRGDRLSDLTKTTFFNWDAAVFEVKTGVIHCTSRYFDELHGRLLKINLLADPNPEGTAIRTLRFFAARHARLSYDLAEYVADVIGTIGIEKLWTAEASRHRPARITLDLITEFLEEFRRTKSEGRFDPISRQPLQLTLDFVPRGQTSKLAATRRR